jgi:hypothetical protein
MLITAAAAAAATVAAATAAGGASNEMNASYCETLELCHYCCCYTHILSQRLLLSHTHTHIQHLGRVVGSNSTSRT